MISVNLLASGVEPNHVMLMLPYCAHKDSWTKPGLRVNPAHAIVLFTLWEGTKEGSAFWNAVKTEYLRKEY